MYPEKAKRETEKPKRRSRSAKYAHIRFILVCLFLVPSLFYIVPRLKIEQSVDMLALTIIISLTVYLVYEILRILLANALGISSIEDDLTEFPQESEKH